MDTIASMEYIASMYREYVHMQHGGRDDLSRVKAAINDLQEGEILQIRKKGGEADAKEKE